MRLEFEKEIDMEIDPIKSRAYIKYHSLLEALTILSYRTGKSTAVEWGDLKSYWKFQATFLVVIYYLQVFTKNRKNNNTTEVCSPTPLPNILKHSDQRWDFLTIWKIRFLQVYFENIWQHIWKFRFIVLHNHHWNTIRTRCLRTIKIGYDILNHLGN